MTVFIPLAIVLSCERVRGTELRLNFGEENVNINFQNLITIPLVCGLASGLVSALSARLLLLSGADATVCRSASFITLVLTAVFMAFSVSGDSSFSSRILKNKVLFIVAPAVLMTALIIVMTDPLSALFGMGVVELENILISLALSIIPMLIAAGIRLVKKYVFNIIKQ